MLKGGHRLGAFSVGKASPTDMFVTDLKLRAHELNQAHLIHKTNIRFFEDLDIRNCLPRQRGETTVKRKVPKKSVDSVKKRAGGQS